jgi:hypothetical protein
MAIATDCQTPGAEFTTHVRRLGISVHVVFGQVMELDEDQAKLLEANLHNAIELVLAPYYASK